MAISELECTASVVVGKSFPFRRKWLLQLQLVIYANFIWVKRGHGKNFKTLLESGSRPTLHFLDNNTVELNEL